MFNRNFILSASLISVVALSGCSSGLLTGEQPSAPVQPAAPPAPIVVDGVRTSYADVVEKTSPAVVRIEAEIKGRSNSQTQFNLDDLFRQGPGQQRFIVCLPSAADGVDIRHPGACKPRAGSFPSRARHRLPHAPRRACEHRDRAVPSGRLGVKLQYVVSVHPD